MLQLGLSLVHHVQQQAGLDQVFRDWLNIQRILFQDRGEKEILRSIHIDTMAATEINRAGSLVDILSGRVYPLAHGNSLFFIFYFFIGIALKFLVICLLVPQNNSLSQSPVKYEPSELIQYLKCV